MTTAVSIFQPPRLPYHDVLQERFEIDKTAWKALVEAVFPNAKTPDAIVMALAYCRQRNLDIFKKPVHIVPIWDSSKGGYVETVWPGISELRTTAMRTREYAGCDEVVFGPDITTEFEWHDKKKGAQKATVIYPAWAAMTIYRLVGNMRVAFPGPKVRWMETCATRGPTNVPNDMWMKRPFGQIEKCAEAASLRRAFPEEIGNDYAAEEMEGKSLDHITIVETVKPEPRLLHAEFEEPGTAEDAPKQRKPRAPKPEPVAEDPATAPQVSQDAPEEVEATLGAETVIDPSTGEILAGDDLPEGLRPQPDAPAVEEPTAQSGSANTETSHEASSEAQPEPDGTAQTASHSDEPESEEAVDDLPPGLSEFADAVEAATEWKHVHGAMHDFFRGDEFRSFTVDRQNGIRNQTWEIARSIHDAPDFTKNLTAYRLWIEWMDEPANIEEVWSVLQEAGAFKDAAPDSQKNLRNATEARLTRLTR